MATKTKFTVTQNGIPFKDYKWDEKTKTFYTIANNLVIDFGNTNGITFNTGSYCTFNTCNYCTFKTGNNCTFNTDYSCTFNTDSSCTFKTGYFCTFTVGENCFGIRYDVEGINTFPANQTVKYNDGGVKGFTIVEPPVEEMTMEQVCEALGKNIKIKK
jgi:hypothetical protein